MYRPTFQKPFENCRNFSTTKNEAALLYKKITTFFTVPDHPREKGGKFK